MNLLLQKDEPMIHVVHDRCVGFLTDLLVRFVKPDVITAAKNLQDLDFHDRSIQKSRENLTIGRQAKVYLKECKEQGLMSSADRTRFYDSVRKYYTTAAAYVI